MGFFFSKEKSNARANVEEALGVLESLAQFAFERPAKERPKLRSVEAVMDAFPAIRLVIDTKEQRIQRPSGKDTAGNSRQKPYYSGKKKAHTLKTEIAVDPHGQIEALSASVPGSTHDLTLIRTTRLLDRLDEGEGALFDKAYDGITNDYPELPLVVPFKARRNKPLIEDEQAYNRHLSKYRIVVEHTNAQLQKFQALAQQYRHDRRQHTRTVRVVASLVNRQIETRPLKSYPAITSSVA